MNIEFDRRFHKDIFFRRLGIAIYSLVGFILNLIIFVCLEDINLSTTVLIYSTFAYILGFIIYSIILLITDKKITYDVNKVNKGYKIGFIITKTMSYITFTIGTSILLMAILIGLIGNSLANLNRYDKGDMSNVEPMSIYTYEEYDKFYQNEINHHENLKDFVFAETETRRFMAMHLHTTLYYSYNDNTIYSQQKNNILLLNNLLNKSLLDEEGNYIFPLTHFKISGFTLCVVTVSSLDNLHIMGFNDENNALVELKSDGAYYNHFGDDIKIAEEAFIEYITNTFYLPWCESIE